MDNSEKQSWIWLEVSEVRFDAEESPEKKLCRVLLKGDREHPKPVWWPVEPQAVRDNPFETYKAILSEMDKKRVVLARLSCSAHPSIASPPADVDQASKINHGLCCDAFRFQAPELGGPR